MSHWAEINSENIVVNVIVGNDEDQDEGYRWIIDNLGGTWVKTSYNGNIRKNFAGIGYKYDEDLDAFISPKLFPSWVFNEETCQWTAPVNYPKDNNNYMWNENTKTWDKV
jgi:hypothetical protein